MPSIKAAELVKIFEGCYRDVNIALANELAYVCEREGVDSKTVFGAANTQPYCKIHNPGYVGGHCIPYYPWFVIDDKTGLMRRGREVNEKVIDRLIDKVKEGLNEYEKGIKDANILILGLTFRGGVHEFEHTAAIPFITKISKMVAGVYAYDPLCTKDDYKKFSIKEKKDFKGIDCAVILTDHKEFQGIDWEKAFEEMEGGLVVDGRRVVDSEIEKMGFVLKRLGV